MTIRCCQALALCLMPAVSLADNHCQSDPLPEPTPGYQARVKTINDELGIPASYEQQTGRSLETQQDRLVIAGIDPGQGVFFMSRAARDAWWEMQAAAIMDGVTLTLISAFRSVERQAQIVRDRLEAGEPIETILKTNTAPGFSEHHTGDALDFTTSDAAPFSKDFAGTEAFEWLSQNAARYCFELSYPEKDNNGIAFEPWHWRFIRDGKGKDIAPIR